ncbi:MAG: hypothetical protein CMJ83_12320 [Planctomycetes bacterium]|nr:hypothetical protein [Planctomycetota bacterium]
MRIASLLGVLVWGTVLGLLGWFFYDMHERSEQERALREAIARLTEERPCARIIVDSVDDDPVTGQPTIRMRWLDTDANWKPRPGAEIRSLVLHGREAYVDAYQIIFKKDAIKEGDPLRGRTLTLFAKVYGSDQKPSDGIPLNVPSSIARTAAGPGDELVPQAYRSGKGPASDLERRLWRRFWDLCQDSKAADREGVRTVQGTAVHKPLEPDMEYRLSINNEGQIFFDGPMPKDPFVVN